jgi:hypothetical protein
LVHREVAGSVQPCKDGVGGCECAEQPIAGITGCGLCSAVSPTPLAAPRTHLHRAPV